MENHIDRLPDELLISIVSHLPLIEAARTSVFARKWRYFWIFNSVLDFDGMKKLCQLDDQGTTLKYERIRFERILNRHSGATIDEFRTSFDLDKGSATKIDKWIEFAFRKRIKKLELNLLQSFNGFRNLRYPFPSICDPIERVRILPLGLPSCESLVTLSLTDVDVTEEVLVFFIASCPFLEELCVRGSCCLENLRTNRQAPRLRHLEIVQCEGFKSIEICSPNLLSYTFDGERIFVALKNVLFLSSLSLGAGQADVLFLNLIQVSGRLFRLETLTLHTWSSVPVGILPKSLCLPRLRKLVIGTGGCESLLGYTSLIDAAPLLREIVLKTRLFTPLYHQTTILQEIDGLKHRSLEVLQIEGFCGAKSQLELALYVIEHAVSLKRIFIDLRPPLVEPQGGYLMSSYQMGIAPMMGRIRRWQSGSDVTEIDRIAMATEGVRLLESKLSCRDVELIIN